MHRTVSYFHSVKSLYVVPIVPSLWSATKPHSEMSHHHLYRKQVTILTIWWDMLINKRSTQCLTLIILFHLTHSWSDSKDWIIFLLTKYATSSLSWNMNKLYKTRTCSKWVTLDLDPQPGRIREPPIDDLPFFGGIFEFHLCSLSDRGEILFVSYCTRCVYIGK
jgi:hypothetical protein